jgi:hypothetical protein
MKKLVLGLPMVLAACLLQSAPASAAGAPGSSARTVTFDTALTPDQFGAGEYDGVLHLTFEPGGIVNGWYRPVDSGFARNVVGGLDGDKLWLDLGSDGLHDINAKYDGGKIDGGTFIGNQTYTFVAKPTKARM